MNGHIIYWIGKTKEEKRITSVLCGYVKFKIPRNPGSGDISQTGCMDLQFRAAAKAVDIQ